MAGGGDKQDWRSVHNTVDSGYLVHCTHTLTHTHTHSHTHAFTHAYREKLEGIHTKRNAERKEKSRGRRNRLADTVLGRSMRNNLLTGLCRCNTLHRHPLFGSRRGTVINSNSDTGTGTRHRHNRSHAHTGFKKRGLLRFLKPKPKTKQTLLRSNHIFHQRVLVCDGKEQVCSAMQRYAALCSAPTMQRTICIICIYVSYIVNMHVREHGERYPAMGWLR